MQGIMVILAHCCTPAEKEHNFPEKAREHADGLLATNPHHELHQAGMRSQNMTRTMKIL